MAAATNTATTQQPPSPPTSTAITEIATAPSTELSSDELAVKAVHKRYEGLVMVRMKAIKGKGAWYWAHLEPILVPNSDTGLPKAVKLRCSLCEALFSASNPSRTASEHLKRGTCPNFNSESSPRPISSISPAGMVALSSPTSSSSPQPLQNHRKRSSGHRSGRDRGGSFKRNINTFTTPPDTPYSVAPLTMIEPARFSVDVAYPTRTDSMPALPAATVVTVSSGGLYSPHHHQQQQQHMMLSGGKEDLGALAMLEDSVKKLKSPKSSPGQSLTKAQIDTSLELLANWVYENCGSVSFSSLEHPKFKSFLTQLGLPAITRRDLAGERLDTKYEEAKAESEARIRDAMFFQISSDGWRSKKNHSSNHHSGEFENLVNLSVNLPNGTSVFRRAVFTSGYIFPKYAEDVLWETIGDLCGNNLQQCVGIVSDRFKTKALRNLENQHQWMINLSCQFQGVNSLIKDLSKELPLFRNVTDNCLKFANFVNTRSQVRHSFLKHQLQEYGRAALLRVPFGHGDGRIEFEPVFDMVEDVLSSARALHLVFLDESCKMVSMEDQMGREIEEMMRSQFWNELEAVHSLVKLIKGMAQEIEKEKPTIGQCLPLWEELRVKIKDWCAKFHINENHVDKVFDKRFKRNYHPAWAAAFILDPFYLIRDASGKYLPPFKCLTSEQEKDVDKLITRLVSREEAPIALMELMKWRTEGLDPVYAQAVQLKQRDPITGKMKIANPQSSRLVWETYLTDFKSLRKVAVRLIFLHATSRGFKWNPSFSRWTQLRTGIEKAQKLIFIAAHSKLERQDFSNDEDKDADFFALASRDDDVLNDVLFDASSL